MVAAALIGAGINAIGGILSGGAKNKQAKKFQALAAEKGDDMVINSDYRERDVLYFADQGINALADDQKRALALNKRDQQSSNALTNLDQARANALRADDEARLRAATGFNLAKLVADAEGAGFNPLTVLNATGGAGYDQRGAVLTSPFIGSTHIGSTFIGKADGYFQKAGLAQQGNVNTMHARESAMGFRAQAAQARIDTAGYFGNALSGLGNAMFDLSRDAAQRNHDLEMINAERAPVTIAPQRAAAGFAPNRTITASPIATTGMARPKRNPVGKISVFDPAGMRIEISRSWAERNGFKPDDQFAPGDFENWLGESGQLIGLGHASAIYPGLVQSGLGITWGSTVTAPPKAGQRFGAGNVPKTQW